MNRTRISKTHGTRGTRGKLSSRRLDGPGVVGFVTIRLGYSRPGSARLCDKDVSVSQKPIGSHDNSFGTSMNGVSVDTRVPFFGRILYKRLIGSKSLVYSVWLWEEDLYHHFLAPWMIQTIKK